MVAGLESKWVLYFAFGVGFLDSTTTTIMRSMIVYLLPSNEVAKIFCVIEFLKNILGLIGPVIFGKMYEKTVGTFPSAFLHLGTAMKVLVFVVSLLVYYELRKRKRRIKMKNSSDKKEDDLKADNDNSSKFRDTNLNNKKSSH